MMGYTIDSLNGALNVKIFWNVSLQHYQKGSNCKKVIAWSGDFGMDQYVSWGLHTNQLTLELIWGKFEDFCKP